VKEYNLISKANERISFYDYGEGYYLEVMGRDHNRVKINRVEARRRWNALIADGWKKVTT